jgi:phage tail sheath protein FI
MPEYLAPGVYVEEVSFRSKSIEGVSTTTTGFVGPTRYGPVEDEPDVITSLNDYERVYGSGKRLEYNVDGDLVQMDNYMWHAARAFFDQGGRRLYVKRVYRPLGPLPAGSPAPSADDPTRDGHAEARIGTRVGDRITIRARFPGAAGSKRVRITLNAGQNILGTGGRVGGLRDRDIVWISRGAGSPPSGPEFYRAETYTTGGTAPSWRFHVAGGGGSPPTPLELTSLDPARGDQLGIVNLTVMVRPLDSDVGPVYPDLALDPRHERAGALDSFSARFDETPENAAAGRNVPIVVALGGDLDDGLDLLDTLLAAGTTDADGITFEDRLMNPDTLDEDRSIDLVLVGGNDGVRPRAGDYAGIVNEDMPRENENSKLGLESFEDIEDISIVAAPGSTFGFENGYRDDAETVIQSLIGHAEKMRYRIAVLDSGNGQTIQQVRAMRATIDSKHAAFYYPWVRILDPITQREIHLPPSGFVAGIYARNDINRAVYKAPANEVVTGAIGFETLLNKSQQDVLNPEGINCFRFFEGRGYRLWGARTISSDPEWKYVNLRRYFAYLEHSVDHGTQWAVFEPNGEALWANVRRTIEDFLLNEWQMGALLGDKPEKAYFVKCDRSTMTQNDLDNGRLVCLIGVAPLRPAEFVIFRIGQWTADRKG